MTYRMRKTLFLLTAFCLAVAAEAQTFTEKLRRAENGKGSVVLNQSSDIERLVNNVTSVPKGNGNAAEAASAARQNSTKTQQHANSPASEQNKTTAGKTPTAERKENANTNHASATDNGRSEDNDAKHNAETDKPDNNAAERTANSPAENDAENVNMNKKIMRNSYKTTGYRIQVYSGGNKRIDREKCNQIAARLKNSFPTLPVYVHFYSPSWKCRAGNFTDYAEAQEMLKQVKAMGYTQACLVKGTISVQY